jgi:hypothetical protein
VRAASVLAAEVRATSVRAASGRAVEVLAAEVSEHGGNGDSAGVGDGDSTSLPPELAQNDGLRLLRLDRGWRRRGRCARLYSSVPLVPVSNAIRD